MTIYFSILGLSALVNLIGFLWLVVTGFKRSVLWGLLVFLFSPLTAVIFALTNWFDARKPFVVYIVSLLLMVGTGVYMYSEVGTENMQKLSSRLQSGEISPDEALRLIEKAMLQAGPVDLFREEIQELAQVPAEQTNAQPQLGALDAATAAPELAEPELAAPVEAAEAEEPATEAQADDQQSPAQEADATIPPPAYPTPDRIVPDPLAVRKQPRSEDSVQISVDKAGAYVGRYLIVEMKNGSQQRGLLARLDGARLVLNRKLYGGNMEYPLYTSQIKSIRVLKQGTEPKS